MSAKTLRMGGGESLNLSIAMWGILQKLTFIGGIA